MSKLPTAIGAAAAPVAGTAAAPAAARVIVVEDNPGLLDDLLFQLTHAGFSVRGATSGLALDALLPAVSLETIYGATCAMPRGELRSGLIGLLRKRHKTRLPRIRGTPRKGRLSNMTSINLRPPEVVVRIVPGHWEGDLIKGAMSRSSVGTLVERTSRYLALVKLDGGTAKHVLDGFNRRLKSVPASLRKTMTYDQGSEMAMHETLATKLKFSLYFCDAHHPWQRGTNENANGLIREFLPKGMDLSQVSHQQLTAIKHVLNHRPRKILGFLSPYEVSSKLSSNLIAGVALQA